jgi:DNA repair exonuclease SbcCD ATPase subunit
MSQARITSIQALETFRAEFAEFLVDAQDALTGVEIEIRRAEGWLQDQQQHWQSEIRKRTEDVQRAKSELAVRNYQNRDGHGMGNTDQKKALKKAQLRLEEAETKLANCRRWVPQLHHAVHEYHGPARLLAGVLDTEGVQALAQLANKLAALESYLKLTVPEAASAPPASSAAEMTTAAVPLPEPPTAPLEPEPEAQAS